MAGAHLRGVSPIGKHGNSQLQNNGWTHIFGQYTDRTDGKLLSSAVYRRSSLEDQHLHLWEICNFKLWIFQNKPMIVAATHWHDASTNRSVYLEIACTCNRVPKHWQCADTLTISARCESFKVETVQRNISWSQITERFVHRGNEASRQITCYIILLLKILFSFSFTEAIIFRVCF